MTSEPSPTTPAQPNNGNAAPTDSVQRTGSPFRSPEPQPPVRWRELLVVAALVALCDLTIYRGHGFAGYAALFLIAPVLLAYGAFQARLGAAVCLVGAMLVLLAAKAIWCGSALLVAVGFSLLAAFAMALSGQMPFVAETAVFVSLTVASGYRRLNDYGRSTAILSPRRVPLHVILPLWALVAFGTVFILANPDLLASVSEAAEVIARRLRELLARASIGEIAFWIAAAWISAGLLVQSSGGGSAVLALGTGSPVKPLEEPSELYAAFRNTLLTVIVLFAAYLVFEFRTLWFREFPKGFYYSGYAHEGAAWLTFALALATVVLSLVFRGAVLRDPRAARLRRLGWIWSAENFVLAVAVYHRLAIYIGFNGMSPMRMVGLYGMSAVVAGFVVVLWKIGRQHSFGWLIRRQLWTLAIAVYLFALTPVDAIVVAYNVRRILAGDPAASVQISVHPISSEGVLLLEPLLNCDDAILREGIRALLAEREQEAEAAAERRRSLGWTCYQLSDRLVRQDLQANGYLWEKYRDRVAREAALSRFHEYAYQWY